MKPITLLIFALLLTPSAQADGRLLLERCSEAVKMLDSSGGSALGGLKGGFCLGYIEGIVDYNVVTSVLILDKPDGTFFCPPQNVTVGQYARILTKFLRENPEILHESNSLVVTKAFGNAFPCPK